MQKRFTYSAATLLLVLGLLDFARVVMYKDNVEYTTGEVIEIWMPENESVKKGNSTWAYFSYTIDDKNYESQNKIPVPRNTEVGDKLTIKYDIRKPTKIYNFTIKRGLILISVAAVLFLVGKYRLT